jgi:hypothetical protein
MWWPCSRVTSTGLVSQGLPRNITEALGLRLGRHLELPNPKMELSPETGEGSVETKNRSSHRVQVGRTLFLLAMEEAGRWDGDPGPLAHEETGQRPAQTTGLISGDRQRRDQLMVQQGRMLDRAKVSQRTGFGPKSMGRWWCGGDEVQSHVCGRLLEALCLASLELPVSEQLR